MVLIEMKASAVLLRDLITSHSEDVQVMQSSWLPLHGTCACGHDAPLDADMHQHQACVLAAYQAHKIAIWLLCVTARTPRLFALLNVLHLALP